MEPKTDGKGGLLYASGVRYVVLATVLVLGALALTFLTTSSAAAGPTHLTWCESTNDLASCIPKTCSGHSRTIVYLGAKWCPWCKRLHDVTFKDPSVRRKLSKMGLVHVDVDDDSDVARHFLGPHASLPTIVVLDGWCHERGRIEGYYDPKPFLKKLDQIN